MCILLFTLSIMVPPDFPFFDTIASYGVHFMFLLLMMAMMFLIIDMRRLMFMSLICAGSLSLFLKNNSNTHLILPQVNDEPSISIAHFNLANTENDLESLLEIISSIDPDLISLQEYTPFWDRYISEALEDKYPHFGKMVRIDPYGLAIFSKKAFSSSDTIFCQNTPILEMGYNLSGSEIRVFSSYITPPLNKLSTDLAEDQLTTISQHIILHQSPVVVVGEFNDVYWSNKMRNFRTDNNLHHSRRNITPTSLDIPNDHIYFSADMECTSFRDLSDKESRRIGILGRYQFKLNMDKENQNAVYGYIE